MNFEDRKNRIYDSLNGAVRDCFGDGVTITGRQRVHGGDINDAFRLELSDGGQAFVKTNLSSNLSFFTAEDAGLRALRQTGEIGVPRTFAIGINKAEANDADKSETGHAYKDIDKIRAGRTNTNVMPGEFSFLLMEWLEPGRKVGDYWERLGHQLASMHKAPVTVFKTEPSESSESVSTEPESVPTGPKSVSTDAETQFGFTEDNYIGASVQYNGPCASWVEFFRDRRLYPQMKMAWAYFDGNDRALCTRLLDNLDKYLDEPDQPSLLHGDLWGGNVMTGPDGLAWIIDPAVYVGHHEADLAMTELFGGFAPAFYSAYDEVMPIAPEYRERRDLYNLYHLLNHLNLFGGGYYGSVKRILSHYA